MSGETPGNKGKDIWSKLSQTLKSGAETIVQETKGITKQGKIRLELLSLENERDRSLKEIGRKAHTLKKEGTEFPSEMADLFEALDGVESRIDEKNEELEKLRQESAEVLSQEQAGQEEPSTQPEAFCRTCGAPVNPNDAYCSKCGRKLG